MTKLKNITVVVSIALLFAACHKKPITPVQEPCSSVCKYIVLGHTYETGSTVDKRIEAANLGKYSQIWLGGDICSETTQYPATLDYLDKLFDLSSDGTHWAVGNHDIRNGHTELITEHTKRPLFYTQSFDGLTLIVLNTNYISDDECDKMEQQTEMIRAVCDTITASSHLVVFMHHIVWGNVERDMNVSAYANVNTSWLSFTCPPKQPFETAVYPELLRVQERGIPVICISGDFGQVAATYERTTADGITFLGSGITSATQWNQQWPTANQRDSVLVLQRDLTQKTLTWEFVDLAGI